MTRYEYIDANKKWRTSQWNNSRLDTLYILQDLISSAYVLEDDVKGYVDSISYIEGFPDVGIRKSKNHIQVTIIVS